MPNERSNPKSVRGPLRGTTYTHDEAANITRIVDPLGGVTPQTFDALGRLASRALPNGVTSTWTYDARGWVDTIVHREPALEDGKVIMRKQKCYRCHHSRAGR